jgi:hypothetical protein
VPQRPTNSGRPSTDNSKHDPPAGIGLGKAAAPLAPVPHFQGLHKVHNNIH